MSDQVAPDGISIPQFIDGSELLPMSTAHASVERVGNVVVLTMNRHEARNALSPDMLVGLADGFTYVDETDDVRCAILTGAGGHFSSGADLKAMSRPSDSEHGGAVLAARARDCPA